MRGVGRGSGAITIVNALPTGIGCAVAIARGVTARLEVEEDRGRSAGGLEVTLGPDTPLLRRSIDAAFYRLVPGEVARGRLAIRSELPLAKGLKSSSAVSVAIIRAVANCYRVSISDADAARLAAASGRSTGVSATGAFDDALASAAGGLALTDNASDVVIHQGDLDPALMAAIWVPEGIHDPSPEWADRFREAATAGREVVQLARSGNYFAAMERNSELVEALLRYDYAGLRSRARSAGGVAAGVSGMGPALAVLTPPERLSGVLAEFPSHGGERVIVGLRPLGGAIPEGSP